MKLVSFFPTGRCLRRSKTAPAPALVRAGRFLRFAAAAIAGAAALSAHAEAPPVLVPPPREVRWADAGIPLPAGSVAIVIGRNAAEPEQEGARLLREFVAKRFQQDWPVLREGEEQAGHRTVVVIGQRTTCALLDRLCTGRRIELDAGSPGPDGYVIETIVSAERTHVIVGGSNARGAMYGQDMLAQMLRPAGGGLSLLPASVRDRPVVPWRGRPQTMVKHYLRPQELDIWIAGRYRQDGVEAAVFAASRKVPGEIGEYAELPVKLPVSGRRDRLALLLFVSGTNKDLFSHTMVPYRWAGYRFIQVVWRDQVLWEHDLGQTRETGDWFMIRLPKIPDGIGALDLRVRVEDRRLSLNNYTVAFVSPLRLMELPE